MTEQEFNEIKSLIIGLGGITEFKSTADRVDNALNILERNKQLLIHSVVGQREQCAHGKEPILDKNGHYECPDCGKYGEDC